ncbi:MAG: hypothetical protein KGQ59_03830 [Bdellovibrionales bacterium]|nr:hypothetical protein [Bdellovibrionales bacterium]
MLHRWLKSRLKSIPQHGGRQGFSQAYLTGSPLSFLTRKMLRFFPVVGVRTLVHFMKFYFIAVSFPMIQMHVLASWFLGLSLMENFFYGFNEDLRHTGRKVTAVFYPWVRNRLRARRWVMMGVALVFLAYEAKHDWIPVLTTDRVWSVFDYIRTVLILKTVSHLFFLPDTALIQGQTRLHFKGWELVAPELAVVVMLPVMRSLFGPMGVAHLFAVEFVARELVRIGVFLRTKRHMNWRYSILSSTFRSPRSSSAQESWKEKLAIPASSFLFGMLQVLFRVESVALLAALHHLGGSGIDFFLLIPMIRFPADFMRNLSFERFRERTPLDQWVAVKMRRPIFGFVFGLMTTVLLGLGFWMDLEPRGQALVFGVGAMIVLLTAVSLELYAFALGRIFGVNRRGTLGFWRCQLSIKTLPVRLETELRQMNVLFFGRGEVWIEETGKSKGSAIEWIRFFGGALSRIEFITVESLKRQRMSSEDARRAFGALVPNGKVYRDLSWTKKEDFGAVARLANRFLRNAYSPGKTRGSKLRITAANFARNEVLFFVDPTVGPSAPSLRWLGLIADHQRAARSLSGSFDRD